MGFTCILKTNIFLVGCYWDLVRTIEIFGKKKPLREKEKKLSNNNFSTQIVGSKIKIGHPKVSFYIPGSKRFYILNLSSNKDGKINVKG